MQWMGGDRGGDGSVRIRPEHCSGGLMRDS